MLLWQPKKFWYADLRAKKNENGNGQKGKKTYRQPEGQVFLLAGLGWVSFAQMSRAQFFAVLSLTQMSSAQW